LDSISKNLSGMVSHGMTSRGLPSRRMLTVPSSFLLAVTGFLSSGRPPCSFRSGNSPISKRTVQPLDTVRPYEDVRQGYA
jgi:hypothetical protein